jgi:hypothetical protein
MFAIKAAAATPALTVSGSGWKIRGMEVAPTDRAVYRSILVTASGDDLDFDRTYVHTLEDGTTRTDSGVKIGYNITGNRIIIHESRMSYFPAYQLNSKLVDNTYPVLMTAGDRFTSENRFSAAGITTSFSAALNSAAIRARPSPPARRCRRRRSPLHPI